MVSASRKAVDVLNKSADFLDTQHFQAINVSEDAEISDARSILAHVYEALRAKGYDPITQIVGYLISGDPTYITSFQNARSLVCRVERDDIIEELVRSYIKDIKSE